MSSPNNKLVMIAAVIMLVGILEAITGKISSSYSEVGVIGSFIIIFLLFIWCREHAEYHDIDAPRGSAILVAAISLIGVPYYFIGGFGLKHGLFKTFLALLYLLAIVFLYAISALLTQQLMG